MNTRPLSILHVLAPTDVGGLETVVINLSAEQRRRGHAVAIATVVPPGRPDHPLFARVARTGIAVHTVALGARAYLRERRMIGRLCQRIRPDVVHTHGFRPDILDAPAARKNGAASVTTVHGFLAGTWRGRVYEWLQERSYRRFDAVVAVSRAIRTRLLKNGVPEDRIHVLPNALRFPLEHETRSEARRALGLPDHEFIVGWIGRLSREKGPDIMLQALTKLDSDIRLSLLGAGREHDNLRRLASRLGVESRIHWHGVVSDATRFVCAFDVVALTSRTEGTPMVLLETMEAMVPVIATSVGGIPDVVTDQEAILVPPESPIAVAEAVRRVRSDRCAAMTRARAASRRLEECYAVAPWAERYDRVYWQALQRAKTARVRR